jgi:hypothetical protein
VIEKSLFWPMTFIVGAARRTDARRQHPASTSTSRVLKQDTVKQYGEAYHVRSVYDIGSMWSVEALVEVAGRAR